MTSSMDYNGIKRIILEEHAIPGMRLGRNVVHDERSKEYQAELAPEIKSTAHPRMGRIFDQGDLGSCTGNAAGSLLMTTPFYSNLRVIDESICILIYSMATRIDAFSGYWPPTDTGSSGLAVMKALKNCKMIKEYRHTFSFTDFLRALVLSAGLVGIPWFDSFDHPASDGMITISPNADVRGGHELEVTTINVEGHWVGGPNSWGPLWGRGGWWRMPWDSMERCLAMDGDFTVPIL